MIGTGLSHRGDVYLAEYTVLDGNPDVITFRIGIASSMGYVRSCTDISQDPSHIVLRFYSAFGGLNSKICAQNVFLVTAEQSCQEIYFESYGNPRLVLQRNPLTGQWEPIP